MPAPRTRPAQQHSDPFAAIEAAADREADAVIVEDYVRRKGGVMPEPAPELPSGLRF